MTPDHNEKLIELINAMNANSQQEAKVVEKKKAALNTQIIEEAQDPLAKYLEKYKSFKAASKPQKAENLDAEPEAQSVYDKAQNNIKKILNTIERIQDDNSYERYSKNDSNVFTNKAKREDTQVTSTRWKQYSNTKASVQSDKNMAPLKLNRYYS